MKLMTYNIYNGAADTLDNVITIVNEENPDVLCLNEANGFDNKDNEKLKSFAEQTNLPYYHLEKCGDGDDYHVVILSKTPVNQDASHSQMRLDYIFISKSLEASMKDYRVIKNSLTDHASDHYPIVAEIIE